MVEPEPQLDRDAAIRAIADLTCIFAQACARLEMQIEELHCEQVLVPTGITLEDGTFWEMTDVIRRADGLSIYTDTLGDAVIRFDQLSMMLGLDTRGIMQPTMH